MLILDQILRFWFYFLKISLSTLKYCVHIAIEVGLEVFISPPEKGVMSVPIRSPLS